MEIHSDYCLRNKRTCHMQYFESIENFADHQYGCSCGCVCEGVSAFYGGRYPSQMVSSFAHDGSCHICLERISFLFFCLILFFVHRPKNQYALWTINSIHRSFHLSPLVVCAVQFHFLGILWPSQRHSQMAEMER